MSIPNDGRYPTLELDPQQRRQRTLQSLIPQLQSLTHQSPVLMIFEDAHWTALRSLELFGRIVARIATLPVTADRDVPAGVRSALDRPTARDFPHDQGAMIDRLVGNKPLGADLRQDIIERTDGIPLFVEEMTKAMLEFQPRPAPNQRETLTWHSPALVGDQAALNGAAERGVGIVRPAARLLS